MPHESRQEFYEHQLERTLIAWYACRLNPEYRKDWQENLDLVTWLRERIEESPPDSRDIAYINHPVTRWLRKYGAKWGFHGTRGLLDPEIHIPYYPPDYFGRCKLQCKHKVELGYVDTLCPYDDEYPNDVTLCRVRYFAFRRLCPYPFEDHGYVQPVDPSEGFLNSDADRKKWGAEPLGKFATEARGRGEMVYWISGGLTRRSVRDYLLGQIEAKQRLREREGVPTWDKKLLRTGIVHAMSDESRLVLSINPRASRVGMLRELDELLRKNIVKSGFSFKLTTMWQGLRYYERANTRKQGLLKVKKDECGREIMSKHWRLRKRDLRHPKVQEIERAYKLARTFVERQQFRKLVPGQEVYFKWNEPSPQQRPSMTGGPWDD